jgi:hypothetical protein
MGVPKNTEKFKSEAVRQVPSCDKLRSDHIL